MKKFLIYFITFVITVSTSVTISADDKTKESKFQIVTEDIKFKDESDRITVDEIDDIIKDAEFSNAPSLQDYLNYTNQLVSDAPGEATDPAPINWNEDYQGDGGVNGGVNGDDSTLHKYTEVTFDANDNGIPKINGQEVYIDTGTSNGGIKGLNWPFDMNYIKDKGSTISMNSNVFYRDFGGKVFHSGIDLNSNTSGELGETKKHNLYAPCDAEVVHKTVDGGTDDCKGYGNTIWIKFTTSNNVPYIMAYCHCDWVRSDISEGAKVKKGQLLARIGNSQDVSGAMPVHLHWITQQADSYSGASSSNLVANGLVTPWLLYGMTPTTGYGKKYNEWLESQNITNNSGEGATEVTYVENQKFAANHTFFMGDSEDHFANPEVTWKQYIDSNFDPSSLVK